MVRPEFVFFKYELIVYILEIWQVEIGFCDEKGRFRGVDLLDEWAVKRGSMIFLDLLQGRPMRKFRPIQLSARPSPRDTPVAL